MGRLEGKVCVVTGAARGMGEATARRFAQEGAIVILADILDEAADVAGDIGPAASFFRLNITEENQWEALRDQLVQAHGRVDVLINNAASIHISDLLSLEKSDFSRLIDINLIGAWLGVKVLGKQMVAQGKGSIVNILSTGALEGINGLGAYVATKWGLRGLTQTAAMELSPLGVRVNAVCPGGIASPMSKVEGSTEEMDRWRMSDVPIPRLGEPEEVANASLFLASDEASYVTANELVVDGGLTTGPYREFLPGAPKAFVEKVLKGTEALGLNG